jgi:predicted ribosome quality control (RQC) complex YloA/Tae2 family protein
MAYDGVLLNCVVTELYDKIIDKRIEKIYQPEKDEIHLHLRSREGVLKIILSASANNPRIHLLNSSKSNPLTPPMFCMLLRKHLGGGRIVDVVQPQLERIVEIYIENINELGDLVVKKLIIEIMGRHSNIILVDDTEKIIDSIKRVTKAISRIRQVLPGKTYVYPPSQGKRNPLEETLVSLYTFFESINTNKKLENVILQNFMGISRATAAEIVYRAEYDNIKISQNLKEEQIKAVCHAFIDFFEAVKNEQFCPTLLKDENGYPIDIFPFPYFQYDQNRQQHYPSVSEMLETYYSQRDKLERIHQRSSYLLRLLKTNLERCQKKLVIQLEELRQAKEADKFRLWGELITANIHDIPAGLKEARLVNYYDPNDSIVAIPMDDSKSPLQNAQEYFKKYSKAKNALTKVSQQIIESKEEIDYLEGLLDNLDKCTEESEIEEVKQELTEQRYIKSTKKNKKRATAPSKPYHFISSDGFDIFVGKNNYQNDRLTLRTAERHDIWLHTKEIPGSHVIIKSKGQSIPEGTLLEAGLLAAYFSKGRNSSRVPVDYCPRKNVKKPNGAKPGMVIYENYNTLYITPSEQKVLKLKKM